MHTGMFMVVEECGLCPKTEVLSVVSRGAAEAEHACVESWHYGALAVVRGNDVVFSVGDVSQKMFPRSALKPFQAVAFFLQGLVGKYAVSARETAVMVGSHNGTKVHIEAVRSLLRRGGLQEALLLCGAQAPTDSQARMDLAKSGLMPERIHHNCSGKHAGFLLLEEHLGGDVSAYADAQSLSQKAVREVLSVFFQTPSEALFPYMDGCGAPTYRISLLQLAHAVRVFANPSSLDNAYQQACAAVASAMWEEPLFVAGKGRFCSALLEAGAGQLVVKNGAEGVYVVGVVGTDTGLAVKVSDGHERGYFSAVVRALLALGVWETCPPSLLPFLEAPVYNTQKICVGHTRSVLHIPSLKV